MKSLYLRIWLTVVAALALFALASGWLVQRHLEQERARAEAVVTERMAAWGDLIQNSIPGPEANAEDQARALRDWSRRLRVPLALHDAQGERIGASESYLRREAEGPAGPRRPFSIRLDDGRVLWLMRPNLVRMRRDAGFDRAQAASDAASDVVPERFEQLPYDERLDFALAGGSGRTERVAQTNGGFVVGSRDGRGISFGPPGPGTGRPPEPLNDSLGGFPLPIPPDWPAGLVLGGLLLLMFLAVAGGAYPVVRRLTRRLELLKQGVEAFGAGALDQRVATDGRDEVAAVATSFNRAATRIEALVKSNQSLLANASHELRSPLARLKMAVTMLDDAPPTMQAGLKREIDTNIAELDALVEEVLLSSRLDAGVVHDLAETVDLAAVAAEEAARVGAEVSVEPAGAGQQVRGSERLLRRAARNLLENARRYGGGEVSAELHQTPGHLELRICDRGSGVPAAERERIFEPFYRLPGHAEREGGVGLGLSLVRQIARAHQGEVRCEAREGGGSCFVITLPGSHRAG